MNHLYPNFNLNRQQEVKNRVLLRIINRLSLSYIVLNDIAKLHETSANIRLSQILYNSRGCTSFLHGYIMLGSAHYE